jgi:hypothetical protein
MFRPAQRPVPPQSQRSQDECGRRQTGLPDRGGKGFGAVGPWGIMGARAIMRCARSRDSITSGSTGLGAELSGSAVINGEGGASVGIVRIPGRPSRGSVFRPIGLVSGCVGWS